MTLLAIHMFFSEKHLAIANICSLLNRLFVFSMSYLSSSFFLNIYLLLDEQFENIFADFVIFFLCSVEFSLCNEIAFSSLFSHSPLSAFAVCDLSTWVKSLLPLMLLWCLFVFPSNSFIISSFTFVFLSILSLYLYIFYRFVHGINNFLLCTWIHM